MNEQKIEQFWRDAKHGDVARVMNREAVEARFRDRIDQEWKPGLLSGWSKIDKSDSLQWVSSEGASWRYCQVYEPQQWWLDKPDPGKGWRLLGKFPHEDLKIGDEAQLIDGEWGASYQAKTGGKQVLAMWYRRRIEPVKQDAGSTSASNIPKGWTALSLDEPRLESDAYWSQGASEWCLIGKDRVEYANRDKWPAIRQRKFVLVQGESYSLPQGLTLEVYKQGFEVF
jgi:hypothetical protein